MIFDTNLWISFLITKDYSFLDKYIENGKARLFFSEELIQEFLTIAKRPKLQKYFTDKDIEHLPHTFDNFGILIKVTSQIKICRDYKDNFLLNLAVDSKADYLATGDKDLLEIKNIEKTKIITIRELKDKL
ncbi:MAG: putative toxin-antitoxin system toxin component, PIN family [Bacteroidales bacterium]|nr:putative toxin-antitoxin system toxin component, PIN family [Bacteroidales bacterium]